MTKSKTRLPAKFAELDHRRGSLLWNVGASGIKLSALSLCSVLFIGAAAAQSPYGPIVNVRQLQSTQQRFESTHDKWTIEWLRWNSRVRSDLDRLYDEVMRAASRHGY